MRVDWDKVRSPESVVGGQDGGLITAITELPGGKLVSILDVEQILAERFGEAAHSRARTGPETSEATVFFADDSLVARKEICQVLDRLKVKYHQATNGQEAWNRLQSMAAARRRRTMSRSTSN